MIKHSNNFVDLTGKKFGRLTVIKFAGKDNLRKTYWLCRCDCGKIKEVYSQKLKTGNTKSCGCFRLENMTKHGDYSTHFYRKYRSLFARCGIHKNYLNIFVCKRWKNYLKFKEDMYVGYLSHVKKFGIKDTTIDRINNKKGYYKNNCKWSTMEEQGNNTSRNVFYTYKGETMTLARWCKKLNPKMDHHTFNSRLRRGWDLMDAALLPLKYNFKTK